MRSCYNCVKNLLIIDTKLLEYDLDTFDIHKYYLRIEIFDSQQQAYIKYETIF